MKRFNLTTLSLCGILLIFLLTLSYYWNENRQYKRLTHLDEVLINTFKGSRYPQIEVVPFNKNLTVRLTYDVSRPIECYGHDCRSYWADHYRYDPQKKSFIQVNDQYKSYYEELGKDYEKLNNNGCSLGTSEGIDLKTLEEVYNYSKTAYCIGHGEKPLASSREELNKFFNYKGGIEKIIRKN